MSKETAIFESAQALFCSIADSLGIEKVGNVLNTKPIEEGGYPTFQIFQSSVHLRKLLEKTNPNKDWGKVDHQKLIDQAFKRIDIDVSRNEIYNFLGGSDPKTKTKINLNKLPKKGQSWYQSSVAIATKIVKALHVDIDPQFNIHALGQPGKGPNWFRGDEVVMGTIKKLYKIANDSETTKTMVWGEGNTKSRFYGYNDINKWSPADIYYANPIARKALEAELIRAKGLLDTYTFEGGVLPPKKYNLTPEDGDGLNTLIARLIDVGALLPLSLKKQTTNVTLKKVNFKANYKRDLLSAVKYNGVLHIDGKPWSRFSRLKPLDNSKLKSTVGDFSKNMLHSSWVERKKNKKTSTRDLRIKISAGDFFSTGDIKFRQDPSGPRWVVELIYGSATAKAGSIASADDFSRIWSSIDKNAGANFKTVYDAGTEQFRTEKAKFEKDKDKLRGLEYKKQPNPYKHPKNSKESEYDHYMGILSGELVTNKVIPLIRDWFDSSTKKKLRHQFVRLLFQVITSRTPYSPRFVIAK
jgi:hypothetical protein